MALPKRQRLSVRSEGIKELHFKAVTFPCCRQPFRYAPERLTTGKVRIARHSGVIVTSYKPTIRDLGDENGVCMSRSLVSNVFSLSVSLLLLLSLRLLSSVEQNTRRNRRLVNVDTTTPLIEHFHPCLLCRARKDAECESLPRVLFREEGYSPLFLNASKVKLISGFETPIQVTTSCGHDHNSLNPFSSVVVTEGHEQLIPFIATDNRVVELQSPLARL
jgi:hypothetical protein